MELDIREEITHMVKMKHGTVEKNSSTIGLLVGIELRSATAVAWWSKYCTSIACTISTRAQDSYP